MDAKDLLFKKIAKIAGICGLLSIAGYALVRDMGKVETIFLILSGFFIFLMFISCFLWLLFHCFDGYRNRKIFVASEDIMHDSIYTGKKAQWISLFGMGAAILFLILFLILFVGTGMLIVFR